MVTILLALLALAQQMPPRDPKPAARIGISVIAGRVVDAQTGAPIAGAMVSVGRVRDGAADVHG